MLDVFEAKTGQADRVGQFRHAGPVVVETPAGIDRTRFDRIPDVGTFHQRLTPVGLELDPVPGGFFHSFQVWNFGVLGPVAGFVILLRPGDLDHLAGTGGGREALRRGPEPGKDQARYE